MNILDVTNIESALQNAEYDDSVGISIARLVNNDSFSLYCAQIDPNKRVGAHYHTVGSEIYQIVNGCGVIHIGEVSSNNAVTWVSKTDVKTGDVFQVKEKEVHQLINNSNEKLIAIFTCDPSHVGDDRVVVDGIID